MKFTQERFLRFMSELSAVILKDHRNTSFRYSVLLLIKKHFEIDMLSFLVFNLEGDYNLNYRESLLDNVTLGLTKESIEEYYNNYYKYNPLYNSITIDNLKNETRDFFSKERFTDSEFYENFYKKYGSFYLVSLGLKYEDKVIGVITFLQSQEEGDFSAENVKHLEMIADEIGLELIKVLTYEKLVLKNHALEESGKYFPVAKVVLDHDYNVVYHNDVADSYILELTGSDVSSFKYFYINELITRGYMDEYDKGSMFDYQDYIFVISDKIHSYSYDNQSKYFYNIFFVKKPLKTQKGLRNIESFEDLTDRELEVVDLIGKGLSNKEIAEKLVISPYTVKTHVQRIYSKCNINSKSELIYLILKK